jgi:hypothetical protein
MLLFYIVSFLPQCWAVGNGLIGFGKAMYPPPCAHACRAAIDSSPLRCTPEHEHSTGHSHSSPTPDECFATDEVFLQTLALCISSRCADQSASSLETYWENHLVGGSTVKLTPKPAMSYAEALQSITVKPDVVHEYGEPLNITQLVSSDDWESQYNGLSLFEETEVGHEKYRYRALMSRAA